MAAGIAHDFNNCLSPIIGLSELILSRPNLIEDHDKVLKYVGTIHKAGLDAGLVVGRLRDYYRDAAGGEEFKVVDLKQVVQVRLKTAHGLPALHVLVIDDDETARNLISEYMSLDGHKVDLADGPGAGLRKIRAGPYDLVITDRAMPEMSGDQLALRSKRAAPGAPVLMLTGLGDFMSAGSDRPRTQPRAPHRQLSPRGAAEKAVDGSSAPMRPISGFSSCAARSRIDDALAALLGPSPGSGPPGSPNLSSRFSAAPLDLLRAEGRRQGARVQAPDHRRFRAHTCRRARQAQGARLSLLRAGLHRWLKDGVDRVSVKARGGRCGRTRALRTQ